MAYQIRGKLEVIEPTTAIQNNRTGSTFYRRAFVLDCTRFNPVTGEPWENHPRFELGGNQCALLDNFQLEQRVEVSFFPRGVKYQDEATGQWKYFTTITAFDIKPVVEQQQNVQQNVQYVAPSGPANVQYAAPNGQTNGQTNGQYVAPNGGQYPPQTAPAVPQNGQPTYQNAPQNGQQVAYQQNVQQPYPQGGVSPQNGAPNGTQDDLPF